MALRCRRFTHLIVLSISILFAHVSVFSNLELRKRNSVTMAHRFTFTVAQLSHCAVHHKKRHTSAQVLSVASVPSSPNAAYHWQYRSQCPCATLELPGFSPLRSPISSSYRAHIPANCSCCLLGWLLRNPFLLAPVIRVSRIPRVTSDRVVCSAPHYGV